MILLVTEDHAFSDLLTDLRLLNLWQSPDLTTDDMCLTLTRHLSTMTTLKINDKRPQVSDKTLQAVRAWLANDKLKPTTFITRYTTDDSDPLTHRSVRFQCKQFTDKLNKAPSAPDATKARHKGPRLNGPRLILTIVTTPWWMVLTHRCYHLGGLIPR